MASILKGPKAMDVKIDNDIQFCLLIASIDVLKRGTVTAAIKTLAEKDMTWETVTEILIVEWLGLNAVQKEDAKVSKNRCTYCNRYGHRAAICWMNPANPNKRLRTFRQTPFPKRNNIDDKTNNVNKLESGPSSESE